MAEKKEKRYVSDNAQLMAEWDWEKNSKIGLNPNQTTVNSHKKVWWICPEKHSYETAVSSKYKGSKCTVCLNRKIVPGINDLSTIKPLLAQEWNYALNGELKPSMVAPNANKNVWWICTNGHTYQATINHRSNGTGCPICAGKRIVVGFNDFETQCFNLVLDWDYNKNSKKPSEYTVHSNSKIFWKCHLCGFEWKTSISNRVNGTGCPKCSKSTGGKNHTSTIIKSKGSLKDNYPFIALEWHFEKNAPLLPHNVVSGSTQKVWWKCSECECEWMMAINKRTSRGSGCPKCRNDKFAKKYRDKLVKKNGSLIDTHPEMANEWNYEMNTKLLPDEVISTSGTQVWWKCNKGHEWKASVDSRTRYKTGCPFCSGRVAIKGENDLLTTHPEIAAEWHPTKNSNLVPSDFKIGSHKSVWWRCSKGHEWKTTIHHRQSTGCPECVKERFTSFPEQAILFYASKSFANIENRYILNNEVEIDIYLPSYSIAIEYDGALFHNTSEGLDREHRKYLYLKEHGIYLIRIKEVMDDLYTKNTADVYLGYSDNKNNRYLDQILYDLSIELTKKCGQEVLWDINIQRDRQSIYRQYMDLKKANSIAILFPHTLDEWDYEKNAPVTPYMVTKGSEKVFWWRCSNGHVYESKVKDRIRNGCPYCSNTKVLTRYNDLATTHPQLAKEWMIDRNDGMHPTEIIGGKQVVWWRCSDGHEWQASIDSRKSGNGCPVCSGKKVLKGVNDLSTTSPLLVQEWNYEKNGALSPTEVTNGSNKKVWWKCGKEHEWQAIISSRSKGRGCPYCANQKVLQGYNDLQTINFELAKDWNYSKNEDLTPAEVTPNSGKKVWWKCTKEHEWQATIASRNRGNGCPYCAQRKKQQ